MFGATTTRTTGRCSRTSRCRRSWSRAPPSPLLDTARLGRVNGSISADPDRLARRAGIPHRYPGARVRAPPRVEPELDPRDDFFGIRPADEALFEVFARRHNTGYLAGHTHRNRRMHVAEAGGAPFVEVACVKDFPGAVAEYRIHDGGIVQVFRRISGQGAALVRTHPSRCTRAATRTPSIRLADRCFTMADRRARTAVAT